jgi:hypothetical protein
VFLSQHIIKFIENLQFTGTLPPGINIMNPYRESPEVRKIASEFYSKFYSDNNSRYLILGINPGRFGAGLTGIPFTDPKRLIAYCGIPYQGSMAHEPSSVYVYDMINAFGGVEKFYGRFYINSLSPLGFTSMGKNGKEINYNYYDSRQLMESTYDFIIDNVRKQIALGMKTDLCYCFGTGKNEQFLRRINDRYGFFNRIIALEHPRYIMQYKLKKKEEYIQKYLEAFREAG